MIHGSKAFRKLVLNMARYSGLATLSRPLASGIGAILMLHHVAARPRRPSGPNSHLSVTPDFLGAVIVDMKALGYDFVSMDEAVRRIRQGASEKPFAAITADDAYRDNMVEALPVLERLDAPITIYVAPALIDGTADLWWDVVEDVVAAGPALTLRRSGRTETLDCSGYDAFARLCHYFSHHVPEEERRGVLHELAAVAGVDPGEPARATLMSWEDIRSIATHPLVTFGAHTVNHFNLKRLTEKTAFREMTEVRTRLKAETGRTPHHFAYPYGHPDAVGRREVRLAAEAGYLSAVTTRHGVVRAGHSRHLLALPRISMNGHYQSVAHIRTMLSGITTPLANRGKMIVTV